MQRRIVDLSVEELNAAFAEATSKAAQKAWDAGLPVTGMVNGRLARVYPDQRIEYLDESMPKDPS